MKEFALPLLPFLIELLMKVSFLKNQSWWKYIDSSTLLLTFSFWALFFLLKTPVEPPIPTDTSVKDELHKLRITFMGVVVVGFSFFGIVAFCKVLATQIPTQIDFFNNVVFYNLTLWTIGFCLITMAFIIWKNDDIAKVATG